MFYRGLPSLRAGSPLTSAGAGRGAWTLHLRERRVGTKGVGGVVNGPGGYVVCVEGVDASGGREGSRRRRSALAGIGRRVAGLAQKPFHIEPTRFVASL